MICQFVQQRKRRMQERAFGFECRFGLSLSFGFFRVTGHKFQTQEQFDTCVSARYPDSFSEISRHCKHIMQHDRYIIQFTFW